MSAMVFDISLNLYGVYGLRKIPNISCNNREIPHATLRILLCNFGYFYYAINTVALVMIWAIGCGSNNEASSANEASAVEASEITPVDEAGSAEQASNPNEAAAIANSSSSSEDASALGSSNEEKDKADSAASKDASAEAGSLKSDDKQEDVDYKLHEQ